MQIKNTFFKIIILLLIFIIPISCSYKELLDKANIQKPVVNVEDVKFNGLSFDAVDLLFNLNVHNPNSVGVSLAGFDYDFKINENSFISGVNTDGLQLNSKASNNVQIPITLKFNDLMQTFKTLANQDSSAYNLACSFSFDLPILGTVKVPVSKSGNFPVLKLPSIGLDGIKLDKLNFTGADLKLKIKMKNNNAFKLFVNNFKYQFASNGNQWISGLNENKLEVSEKGESMIEIPVSLNFLQMGRSIYQMISGDQDFDYQLLGDVDFSTSVPLIGQVKLPFDKTGKIKITK
jgi:LEA14-like dessication related protein